MKIILFYIFVSRFKMRNDFWAEKKEVFVFIEIKTTVVNFHCISIRKSFFDFNIMTRLFYKPLGHFCQKKQQILVLQEAKIMKIVIAHFIEQESNFQFMLISFQYYSGQYKKHIHFSKRSLYLEIQNMISPQF